MARYSYSINIKELNNDYVGVIKPIEIVNLQEQIAVDNCIYSIKINPEKVWQPIPGKFRVKTYEWNCDIRVTQEAYHVKSKWSRIS